MSDPIRTLDVQATRAVRRRHLRSVAEVRGLPAGTKLGDRYVLIEVLGQGGGGVVYRARDLELARDVALKLLDDLGESTARVLASEARALARLDHPGIVSVHDAGTIDGHAYLSMELIRGRSMSDVIDDEGGQPAGRALRLLQGLAKAMDAAHDHGVVHGDVKPANVMLDESGHPRLADFGMAHRHDTDLHGCGGSPGYSAPEIWDGAPPTPRSDIHAFAATAWALLTGRPPAEGATAAELIRSTSDGERIGRLGRERKLNAGLARVLERGLSPEPARRPPSARALVRELRAVRVRQRISWAAGLVLAVAPLATWAWNTATTPALELESRMMVERFEARTGHFVVAPFDEQLVLREGDAFWLEGVRTNRDADVDVFLLDSAGGVTRLFPGTERSSRLEGDVNHRLPAERVWRLDGNVGTETAFVVARTAGSEAPGEQVAGRLAMAAERADPREAAPLLRSARVAAGQSDHGRRERAVAAELGAIYDVVRVYRLLHG